MTRPQRWTSFVCCRGMKAIREGNGHSELLPTRSSLVERMRDLEDHGSWQRFFETYWKHYHIFHLTAVKGLSASEVGRLLNVGAARMHRAGVNADAGLGSLASARPDSPGRQTVEHHLRERRAQAGGRGPGHGLARSQYLCRHGRLRASGGSQLRFRGPVCAGQGPLRGQYGQGPAGVPGTAQSPGFRPWTSSPTWFGCSLATRRCSTALSVQTAPGSPVSASIACCSTRCHPASS